MPQQRQKAEKRRGNEDQIPEERKLGDENKDKGFNQQTAQMQLKH